MPRALKGLDKTPDFALQKQRAIDSVLAQELQQKLVAAVPEPSKEEAQSFIASHPDTFLERKVFLVDQIRMPKVPLEVLKSLEPLKTMDEIRRLFWSRTTSPTSGGTPRWTRSAPIPAL